jgi:Membrane bound O-acyl transferase family
MKAPATNPLRGWGPLLVLPTLVLTLTPGDWPRWLFMWLLAGAIFAGCKWLTWRRTSAPAAPWWQHLGYLVAWPGLDASAFLRTDRLPPSVRPGLGDAAVAMGKLLLGLLLVWGVVRFIPAEYDLVRGWVGMIGIVLMLHFGTFDLISVGWRAVGIDARPLMDCPPCAVSVSEFWGRRWNSAFRDLTHRFLFRPLTPPLGPRGALVAGFVFSGLVHDLVISVPAGGGYGGPTLFFCLQAPALLLERSRLGRSVGFSRGQRGWLHTALVLLLPAGLLFHPPFVTGVVLPFLEVLGAY